MNWLAMARRLVDGADAPRNGWLTLLLVLLPCGATAFDGSVSVELTGGNRMLSASLIGDWGIVPDQLYLVGSYGVVRQAPESDFTSSPAHVFGLGLDWLPTRHVMTSLTATFSPKSREVTRFPDRPNFLITTERRSAQGIFGFGYQSGGLGNVEWAADLGFLFTWYELEANVLLGPFMFAGTRDLFLGRPSAGATLTFSGNTDLSVRGSYSIYSRDPTTICRADVVFCEAGQALNLTPSFTSAPPWFDARISVLHRFTAKVSGRLGYTFIRYVNGIGNQHAVSTKWSLKVTGWARLWAGLAVQYDWLTTASSFWSGYATLGAELATE